MSDTLTADLVTRVGIVTGTDGSTPRVRGGSRGEIIVAQGGGKYGEAVARGNCFSAITAATGVSVASLTITTTGQLTVHNKIGSGKRFSFMRASLGYVSGTYGAGNLVYAVSPGVTTTTPTGTAITPQNLLAGGSNNSSAVALTTSTIAAPTVVRNFCNLGAALASTALGPYIVEDDIDGEIQLLPGTGLTITGTTAAGSSPLVVLSLSWEEIPILSY